MNSVQDRSAYENASLGKNREVKDHGAQSTVLRYIQINRN